MKMRVMLAAAGLAAGLATAVAAEPAAGTWKTQTGETGGYLHVTIAPCGNKICGTIAKVVNNDNQSIVGRQIIWDMTADGAGQYSGGKVWAPDTDKTYKSKMELNGDTLTVKGCVLAGAVCRGQDWTRIN